MRTTFFAVAAALCGLVAAGCDEKPVQPPPPPSLPAPTALDGWPGQWNGVEGTYLRLVARPDSKYDVIIRNLDGERRFEGVGSTDHIDFERDGKQEQIRASDGQETGMKWLADKTNCLTIQRGEGYCRD
jgi:hypothetical protein